jgi:hypothetical protein
MDFELSLSDVAIRLGVAIFLELSCMHVAADPVYDGA